MAGELYIKAVMNVGGYVLFLLMSQMSLAAPHNTLQECLNSAIYHEHRIEKQENVRFCFNEYKTKMTQDECFTAVEKNPILISSSTMKKEALSVCFYETGSHASLANCAALAEKFKPAGEHDEAIFYCYQTFQDKMTKKQCTALAKLMKFPAKRQYLTDHCQNN